jgi:hypothetical protein
MFTRSEVTVFSPNTQGTTKRIAALRAETSRKLCRRGGQFLRVCVPLCAFFLSGCISLVEVHSDHAPPKLSFWPGGVRIARADDDAMAVSMTAVGLAKGCTAAALGVAQVQCTIIDPRSCGVAVIYRDDATDLDLLGRISNQTRAHCLHKGETK